MTSNIIEKALQEINTRFGESLTDLILDSKLRRGGKKDHVWYVGHEWEFKGQYYQSVTYGSWKHQGEFTVKSWDQETESNKSFRAKYTQHTKEAKVKLDIEKQEKHAYCIKKWKPIFQFAKHDDLHPYLKFKGISSHYGSKNLNGILLIPAYKSDKGFVGVQRIYTEDDQFKKKFSSGIEINGAFYNLTPFKSAEYCYVVEGFATAASVQMAFPKIPVICVFNASNISPAIQHIRNVNPKIKIMIGADRDQPNPLQNNEKAGEKYASLAARKYPGVCFRVVKFETNNPLWSDYNDLHQFESLEKVQEQLAIDPAEFTEIICLGYKGDQYFYTSSENPQIVSLSASTHNKGNLTGLVDLPYWYKNFGLKNEDGDYTGIKWLDAESTLKKRCRDKGFFDPDKMRGRGVWADNSRVVINTGEHIYEDGKLNSSLITQYHYLRTKEIGYHPKSPLNDEEMGHLLAVFGSLSLKGKNDYIYLAAWAVQAQIFAVLPWRFHIWISGDRGSGKSTLQTWLGDLIIRPSLNLNSSAAGIRQDIQSDTIPVIYDESEPDNERLKEIIELARQSSSNTGFETRRGTPSGKAIVYNTQALFCMGSIQKGIEKAADLSRFFVVEMAKAEQSLDEYEAMVQRISYFAANRERLFSRAAINANTVLQNYKIVQRYIRAKRIESRLCDQFASLISCFWLYFSTEIIKEHEIEWILDHYGLLKSDYTDQNQSNDAEDCFNAIMALRIDNQGHSVFHFIENLRENKITDEIDKSHASEQALGSVGIRYFPSTKSIFIANGCDELKKRLPSFRDYNSLLKRHKDRFLSTDQMAIANYSSRVRGVMTRL